MFFSPVPPTKFELLEFIILFVKKPNRITFLFLGENE